MMSPLISQLIVIAFGLVVLGVVVYGKLRTSSLYALGLLVVVTAIAGAWLYNDRQAHAAETQDEPKIVYQTGLPNLLLVSVESKQEPSVQERQANTAEEDQNQEASTNENANVSDTPDSDAASAEDSATNNVDSESVNADNATAPDSNDVDETETVVVSDSQTNTNGADIDQADSSFIPLDNEKVPAVVGVHTSGMPEWIGLGDYEKGETDYRLVTAGPNYRLRDCEKELNQMMLQATAEYIDDWLEPGASDYVKFDIRYVKEHLLVDGHKFSHEREYQVGPMHSSYAQLHFDVEFRDALTTKWDQIRVKHRLIHTGIAGVGVLGLLITAFGYLRLDHATRGFYTGRLQFIAGGAILALAVAGAVAWRAIPWL